MTISYYLTPKIASEPQLNGVESTWSELALNLIGDLFLLEALHPRWASRCEVKAAEDVVALMRGKKLLHPRGTQIVCPCVLKSDQNAFLPCTAGPHSQNSFFPFEPFVPCTPCKSVTMILSP